MLLASLSVGASLILFWKKIGTFLDPFEVPSFLFALLRFREREQQDSVMAVISTFDQWQKDVFFSAAEEVQESADTYVIFIFSFGGILGRGLVQSFYFDGFL